MPRLGGFALLLIACAPMPALAQNCKSDGGLRYLGNTRDAARSVWLSRTGAGSFALESAQGSQVVDTWSRPPSRQLHISASPVVSQGNGGTHKLLETGGSKPCVVDTQNQKGGITLPPIITDPVLPPIGNFFPDFGGLTPGLPPAPPSGLTPTRPGGVRPPIGTLPPSGITPTRPGGVRPPIGTLPPSGITPTRPGGVQPPIGTLPPSGITPTRPGGVRPPVGTLPPSGITPTRPGGVRPPIGTLPRPASRPPGPAACGRLSARCRRPASRPEFPACNLRAARSRQAVACRAHPAASPPPGNCRRPARSPPTVLPYPRRFAVSIRGRPATPATCRSARRKCSPVPPPRSR